jgi:hypothetical protein
MNIRQASDGGYRITVTRSLYSPPILGPTQHSSETRTYNAARRPGSAQAAWRATDMVKREFRGEDAWVLGAVGPHS